MEPLLRDEETRYPIFPLEHPDVWERYKTHLAAFWVAGEVDLSQDRADWERLSDDERYFLSMVLAFFASADGIVNDNLAERFGREVTWREAKCFYDLQKTMENVHNEMYSLLIDTYIDDGAERDRLFDAVKRVPCVRKKAAWALEYLGSAENFATRLVAFAVVEGVFFSASFCAIYWLKHHKKRMPGLCKSNELIARDEGLHQDFAAHLYRTHIVHKLPVEDVYALVDRGVALETEFCCDALPVSLLGMDAAHMSQYVRFVADRLLVSLGVPALYGATNPFDFMELISLEGKTNFFETRVTEYQKAGARGMGDDAFATDAAF